MDQPDEPNNGGVRVCGGGGFSDAVNPCRLPVQGEQAPVVLPWVEGVEGGRKALPSPLVLVSRFLKYRQHYVVYVTRPWVFIGGVGRENSLTPLPRIVWRHGTCLMGYCGSGGGKTAESPGVDAPTGPATNASGGNRWLTG
jgi:hypothetical protein